MSDNFPVADYRKDVVFCLPLSGGPRIVGPRAFLNMCPQMNSLRRAENERTEHIKGIAIEIEAYGERHHLFVKQPYNIPVLLTWLSGKFAKVTVKVSPEYYLEKMQKCL